MNLKTQNLILDAINNRKEYQNLLDEFESLSLEEKYQIEKICNAFERDKTDDPIQYLIDSKDQYLHWVNFLETVNFFVL